MDIGAGSRAAAAPCASRRTTSCSRASIPTGAWTLATAPRSAAPITVSCTPFAGHMTGAASVAESLALAPRKAIFVAEYVKDGNGTQAAIRAGYAAKSAHVAAYRLLKDDKV